MDTAAGTAMFSAARILAGGWTPKTGDERFTARHGPETVWLRHERSFAASGKSTGAVHAVAVKNSERGPTLGLLIQKKSSRPESATDDAWLNEAQFYSELRDDLEIAGLAIPRAHAISIASDRCILALDHLAEVRPARTLAEKCLAAGAIGRFAARSHLLRLYRAPWLKDLHFGTHGGSLQNLDSLLALITATFPTYDDLPGLLRQFIEGSGDLIRVREQLPECLCHGDTHSRNLVISGTDPGMPALVDWTHVCRGRIGDDLVLMILPEMVVRANWSHETGFVAAERQMLDAYCAGLATIRPGLGKGRIREGFRAATMLFCLARAGTFQNWIGRAATPQSREERIRRVATLYRRAGSRAAKLIGRKLRGTG